MHFTDSFSNYLTITCIFGKLATWQTSFIKETRLSDIHGKFPLKITCNSQLRGILSESVTRQS